MRHGGRPTLDEARPTMDEPLDLRCRDRLVRGRRLREVLLDQRGFPPTSSRRAQPCWIREPRSARAAAVEALRREREHCLRSLCGVA
jgi:hypothetical protein